MKKIVFIAKTNLNNDGRILNELKILKNKFQDKLNIEFILMEDKPLSISVDGVNKFHIIKTRIRNSKFLKLFTVIEFSFKSFIKLLKVNPQVIHAQDTAIVIPVLFYKYLKGKNVKVIYDDHELPNSNENIQIKILQFFENKLMKRSEFVLFANSEREKYLKSINLGLGSVPSDYLLNLPFFKDDTKLDVRNSNVQNFIKEKQEFKYRYIMHQGIIEEERGRKEIAAFSNILPQNVKILLLGISDSFFEEFIAEFKLDRSKFKFIGLVPYFDLQEYWKLADASLIVYLPTYLNNKLCAPNRLYISFDNSLPIIVNKENPVLSNFIIKNNCGMFLEDLNFENFENIFNIKYSSNKMEELKNIEISKFENIYKYILD